MDNSTYICKPDKCISCDTVIHVKGESFQDKINRGVYKEMTLNLSNGSKMRVGVCNICHQSPANFNPDSALQAIKQFWKSSIRPERQHLLDQFTSNLSVINNG